MSLTANVTPMRCLTQFRLDQERYVTQENGFAHESNDFVGDLAPAIILDCHLKSALAAIRSLGRRGIRVIAGSYRPAAMGFFSQYVRERFLYPSPLANHDAFVECVRRQAGSFGRPILLTFSDSTLLPLLSVAHRDRAWTWLVPDAMNSLDLAFDKFKTLELARELGIQVPDTYLGAMGTSFPIFLKSHGWPLVVKPRRTVYWHGNRGVQGSAVFAISADDLASRYSAAVRNTGVFPLVQEYVSGEEASVQFLCRQGDVLAACANRRLRSVNPIGGPGALKETVPLSYCGLGELGRRLASALKWSGPMMVEFKIDRATSIPKLMEINGRFWGSLPLAIFAGADFPYLYYRVAQGLEVEPSGTYTEGIASRHFMSDLKHLHAVLFKRDAMRSVAYPTRVRAVHDFLNLPRGCKSDVLDSLDILPAFAEMIDTCGAYYSRLKTRGEMNVIAAESPRSKCSLT